MNFGELISSLRSLDGSLKRQVTQSANVGLTLRNYWWTPAIVEFEPKGEERAAHGTQVLPELAERLAVKGRNRSNLEFCRCLFTQYPQNPRMPSGKLGPDKQSQIPAAPSPRPDFALPVQVLARN